MLHQFLFGVRVQPRVYALVLAAGSASRFGSPKQLASVEGTPMVVRACRIAERVCGARTVLISGAHHAEVIAAKPVERGFIVHNENHEAGLASSIVCGVSAVATIADAVLVMLVDQPLITVAHLQELVRKSISSNGKVVATRFGDNQGVPAVFPRQDFDSLMQLTGDRGARPLLDRLGECLETVRFEPAAIDIDRPEDLQTLG